MGHLRSLHSDDRLLVIDLTTPAQPVIKATITDFSAIDSGTLPFDIQSDLHITSVALKGTTGIALVNGRRGDARSECAVGAARC